jgi:hypothetical protein
MQSPQPEFKRPTVLYRYSQRHWLERSLLRGEFRLVPASSYLSNEGDIARQDDELVRTTILPKEMVKITHVRTGKPIIPIGKVTIRDEVGTDYLTLCLSRRLEPRLFEDFGADAVLAIHDPEAVCELIHDAAEHLLPGWMGVDAPVFYGGNHRFGPSFTKGPQFLEQQEWRFSWLPPLGRTYPKLSPVLISIGSIARFADIRSR